MVKVYCLPVFKDSYREKIRNSIVVVFDVFRASTTIILALYGGFKYVIPVKEIDDGLKLARTIRALTAGEKGGRKIKEYHLGNSPYQVLKMGKKDLGLILRSTNGTRIIKALEKNNLIVVGSTVNARAVAEYVFELSKKTNMPIVLIAAGRLTRSIVMNAFEDVIGVAVVARYLEGLGAKLERYCDSLKTYEVLGSIINKLLRSKFILRAVKKTGSSYLKDILLSGMIDLVDIVPVLRRNSKFSYIVDQKKLHENYEKLESYF